MQCAESLRLQAYFDSELDAASAHEVERHLDHCVECRDLLNDLKLLRDGLRRELPIERAPGDLRARILAAIDREAPPARPRVRPTVWRLPAFWAGAFSGLGGAAAAAALAWFLILPISSSVLVGELVNAHVHSLLPDHLIAVVSTDRHTVKPWFAGHADVSPSVADFDAQGYRLIGGRADYIDHQRSAVVVYQHGAHVINVFTWAANGTRLPSNTTRSGYHLAFWQHGDIQCCAVSDTGWDELLGLVRLLREQP